MLAQLLLVSSILWSCVTNGNAGVTSDFVRNEWPSVDIPLDNEAFAVPKGYNAPQQVSTGLFPTNVLDFGHSTLCER